MNLRTFLLAICLTIVGTIVQAADDYKTSAEFLALRDSMHHAFNDGDSARFYPALKNLQDYLLQQGDLQAYYTQRCNEVIFLMNQQHIYEAYKTAQQMTQELREKKHDNLMYMALNMMGHINRYCGNGAEAKKNWYEVISLMEKNGYYSSMPSIYMNIVNVALDDSTEEADSLLDIAKNIAKKYSPERVFDIESRHTLSYYYRGDYKRFLEGYKAYKEGEKKGLSSVHGRSMEVYRLALDGYTDEAVEMARKELGDEGVDAITMIYEKAGRWQEAFQALKKQTAVSDSIDNVVIKNSMQGIREQVMLHESQQAIYRARMIGVIAVIFLLILLIAGLIYFVQTRRRHLKELKSAYRRAMESENMKAAFIQNISHEIRTPLNIISGFAQVIANPDLTESSEERQHIARMMEKNAHHVTALIDEIIGLSLIESTEKMRRDDTMAINKSMRLALKEFEKVISPEIKLKFETTLSDEFTLKTNEKMVLRIINALLENASKYTKEGHIALRADRDDNLLTFTVEDTGCGIPAEEAEHIFERFVKLDSFKEGIGLGLPLSRKLAEQLDGNVILDTSYTDGARFYIKIPIPS
jgi:signal transduction histidine kinase